ncbi:V-type H(+)-translocating pyrophosphatase [Pseudothermotoga thermarum DSM 5069]|uniref:Putative K(+)-stimulated pyrophosphate-energized sodium pump n=1 Tax=Pseudothermotoga thermarum DSM 5069 TaxID=688269 RepID=F7YWF6_9THEM|nr:V-type H(+)-translocating pyrophosphatase [Pseudothermotoga thermarum DSM 5069]
MLALFLIVAISCAYTIFLTFKILDSSPGNEKTIQLSLIIQKGARSFLLQEYSVFFPIVGAIVVFLSFFNFKAGISLLLGALFSTLAGFFGMVVATKSNARTSWAALYGMDKALRIAFQGGAVMGLTVSALGLLGIGIVLSIFKEISYVGYYSFGASFVALFARVGGGIYTKAADVGADIVGKTEANLPEDDPRNPAVIADNVGDNVGDVAGMGADLYESYIGSIFSALALASFANDLKAYRFVIFVALTGLVSSMISVLVTSASTKKFSNPGDALRFGSILSNVLLLVGILIYSLANNYLVAFVVVLMGVVVGISVGLLTEFYTSSKKIAELAKSANMGAANILINGIALGMESTAIITIMIVAAVMLSYKLLGLFGVALSAVGMLSTLGMNLSIDAYGPIADNAGGIAQMAGLDERARRITDQLDAVGNTTAAMGKGFAIVSAALTALALFSNYANVAHISAVDIRNPSLFTGALIGAMLPFLFCALAMKAVGDAADEMVEEIRRQIREIPGIISGHAQPDYERCIKIATKGALRRMVLPSLLAILVPIAGYFTIGSTGTAGILIGSTVTGVMVAIFMANSGGAWDNAKKYIEEGHFGGKGSMAHKASVVGDTVGDPLKDTAGPSINILIKLMAITSVILATLVGR